MPSSFSHLFVFIFASLMVPITWTFGGNALAPTNMLLEYLPSPVLGVDVQHPRFSWTLTAANNARGLTQESYRIQVSLENGFDTLVWDSGVVNQSLTYQLPYFGPPLSSDTRYFWRVCVGLNDSVSPWSQTSEFSTGLFQEQDWQGAQYIRCATIGACLLVRTTFEVDGSTPLTKALAYFSSVGWGELWINDVKASGSAVLEPGISQWDARLLYATYDVSEYLVEGLNGIGMTLGTGWPGHMGFVPGGSVVKVLLSIEYSNGTRQYVASTPSWQGNSGPIDADDIYAGEAYNALNERPGWSTGAYDASTWDQTSVPSFPAISNAVMSSQMMPPIRALEYISPVSMSTPVPGMYVFDFGQNFAGWCRLSVVCSAGVVVALAHAEVLFPNGTLNQQNLLAAAATDYYTCKGSGQLEVYEPRFTQHGFRFVSVTGYPGIMNLDNIAGHVVHSDVPATGQLIFTGQNLLNEIHHNIQWVQKSNLMSVPTDCDQRSERMGWMADASVSAEEAIFNYWMPSHYSSWLRTMRDYQLRAPEGCSNTSPIYPDCNGTVADTIPHTPAGFPNGQRPADPSWGVAYPLIYDYVTRYYQDAQLLLELYPGIRDYVEWHRRVAARDPSNLVQFYYYGDWLQPGAVASSDLISRMSSAFNYIQSIRIVRDAAQRSNQPQDFQNYAALFDQALGCFNTTFFNTSTGTYGDGTQAALTYPLYLGIGEESWQQTIFAQLLRAIENVNYHVQTGILTTKWMPEVLSSFGRSDVVLRLLLQEDFPSWGYMVLNNATTIWEHWEYLVGAGMNSHAHPALGSIGSWMYKYLLGIRMNEADDNGFSSAIFSPEVVNHPQLTGVEGSIVTMQGPISCAWELSEVTVPFPQPAVLNMQVTVPIGAATQVRVPLFEPDVDMSSFVVKEGDDVVWQNGNFLPVPGISAAFFSPSDQKIYFECASGSFFFQATYS